MSSPTVQQLEVLSNLFRDALAIRSPASVAILGIAGGNGLEHVNPTITKRVVGIDINPQYLDVVRRRFSNVHGLELHCRDLNRAETLNLQAVDLVHAALLFEHAGTGKTLENAISLVAKQGALCVVLQLPAPSTPDVSISRFAAMQTLKSHFSLVDPTSLTGKLTAREFELTYNAQRSLPAGKAFWMGIFARP